MNLRKVLVVDDEHRVREVLTRALERAGYETCTAGNGDEALRQLSQEQPDLLITDLVMPGMDGYELCRRVRELSTVPVVVITANRLNDDDQEKAFSVGADELLKKPFDLKGLLEMVEARLAKRISRTKGS